MNANAFALSRGARRLVALGLSFGLAGTALHAAKEADAFPNFESYIKVSGKAPSVSGDPAAYAERFQTPEEGSYGIEDLHLSKDVGEDTTMVIDGKALVGPEDYLGKSSSPKVRPAPPNSATRASGPFTTVSAASSRRTALDAPEQPKSCTPIARASGRTITIAHPRPAGVPPALHQRYPQTARRIPPFGVTPT